MNKILISAFLSTVMAISSTADDEKHFNGGYAGIEAGFSDSNTTVFDSKDDGSSVELSINDHGIYYGNFLGYRVQFNNGLVVGGEATIGKASVRATDYIWTLSTTLGYAFGHEARNLAFLNVGYGATRYKTDSFNIIPSTSQAFEIERIIAHNQALNVAAGYEHAFGNVLSLRLKVNSFSFEEATASIGLIARF